MSSVNKKYLFWIHVVLLVIPACIHAQDFSYMTSLGESLLVVASTLVPILLGIALIVFVWGLLVFIAKADNEQERDAGKQKMFWGIIGLFVLVSVWGIILLMQDIVGVEGTPNGLGPPGIPF
ncbi:TPA: hypothetical protein DEP58_04905 [Patescibacteria group bacterium]|nr:MAG: hypothetical protein UU98_C0040G0002 [Parcubacteria group bacterium GW2011_GWD2_42_14]HCC05605.1 hypothetical protein [Patescibacteria group bacterium]